MRLGMAQLPHLPHAVILQTTAAVGNRLLLVSDTVHAWQGGKGNTWKDVLLVADVAGRQLEQHSAQGMHALLLPKASRLRLRCGGDRDVGGEMEGE